MNDQATMTNRSPRSNDQTGWIPGEVCNCRQCETQIPGEMILVQLNRHEIGPTRQRVRAWCEHCKAMFEMVRELRGGVWQRIGDVETVTDPKRRAAFLRRIQAQRGLVDAA